MTKIVPLSTIILTILILTSCFGLQRDRKVEIIPGKAQRFHYTYRSGFNSTIPNDLKRYLDTTSVYVSERESASFEIAIYIEDINDINYQRSVDKFNKDIIDFLIKRGIARNRIEDRFSDLRNINADLIGALDIVAEIKVVF